MNYLLHAKNAVTTAASAVNHTVQISKLDKIVERRVQDYESYVNDYTHNLAEINPEEKAKEAEEQFISRCLSNYDKEACEYMGRPVNDNWMEGGGDNLEVRKRMLNRQLQARRGQLVEAVSSFNKTATAQLEVYLVMIQNFERQLRYKLPCGDPILRNEYQTFMDQLDQQIILTFAGGYHGFNRMCNNALETAINEMKSRVALENNAFAEKAIQEFRQKMLRQYLTVLREQVTEARDRFKLKFLEERDVKTDLVTPAVILDLNKQIDILTQQCLTDIGDNAVDFILR
eukprot:gene11851-12928_t